jgi:hypothetical protein
MGRKRTPSEDLAKLSEAVARWREQHGGGGRGRTIPEELWNEAVRVARLDGLWLTAKATRLQYDAIKQRIARADGSEVTTAVRASAQHRGRRHERRACPNRRGMRAMASKRGATRRQHEFVELSAAQLLGAPSTTGTVVEVEDKAGVRMIVRLAKQAHVDEVARLISVFRRRRG